MVFGVERIGVEGLFMSLSTTLRASSSARCGIASQISSQVKARIGANIFVMLSRMRYSAVWRCGARPSRSSQ